MSKPLLESFDLITRMVGSGTGGGGGVRRGVEETGLVDGEESKCVILFPVPGGSDGVSKTEWVVFIVTWC